MRLQAAALFLSNGPKNFRGRSGPLLFPQSLFRKLIKATFCKYLTGLSQLADFYQRSLCRSGLQIISLHFP